MRSDVCNPTAGPADPPGLGPRQRSTVGQSSMVVQASRLPSVGTLAPHAAGTAAPQFQPAVTAAHVVLKADTFSHEHARAISRWALGRERAGVIVVDLSRADDATTAAFAALVVLRRKLLRDGRDLRLSGLRDRPRQLYAVNRLGGVLPA